MLATILLTIIHLLAFAVIIIQVREANKRKTMSWSILALLLGIYLTFSFLIVTQLSVQASIEYSSLFQTASITFVKKVRKIKA